MFVDVTLGVPRIKEILDARKKITTPIITVELEGDICMGMAEGLKGQIDKTTLSEVSI